MRVMIIAVLLLALAFAGCASKGKGGDGSESDLTSSATQSGSSTKSGSATGTSSTTSAGTSTGDTNSTNRAPTAQLAASTPAGSLQVNFTVDGADLDGDNLTWELSFGDGSANETGTALPGNTTYTYANEGTYTATLTVSDGTLDATSSVNVTLAAGAPAAQDFEGEWAFGSVDIPFAADQGGAGCDAIEGMDGVFLALFDIDAATIGKTYAATVTAESTNDSIVAWEVKFLDADCGIIEGPYIDGSGPITGTVPVGAVHAWMSSDGGASVTGTYHAG